MQGFSPVPGDDVARHHLWTPMLVASVHFPSIILLAGRHCLIRDYFFLRDPRDLAAVAMEYRSKALRFFKKLLLSLELLPA